MSQERTERNKTRTSQTRDARIGKIKELHANVKYTEADELEEAYAEIERLNSKCANLEGHNEKLHNLANDLSKEQEYAKRKAIEYNDLSVKQAEEIDRLNAVIEDKDETSRRLREEINRLENLVEKQVDIISGHDEAMRLAKWMHQRDTREIERLRAVIKGAAERLKHTMYDECENPTLERFGVIDSLLATLKGAE